MASTVVVLWAVLATPVPAHAQEVSVAGSVTDASMAILPGVTVTARHVASGTTFIAVTDASGAYRIGALRSGVYDIIAELPGFSVVTQAAYELLLGQRAVLDFELTLASVQETVTVTGASPLIDVQQSKMGGNIDARQMEALPVNGRNWMQLTMLAPGSRVNAIQGDTPLGNLPGSFQVIVDGQQVTNTITYASIGQPAFSRDAIAEFELLSSRFDATQGRSAGLMVNAVTKSGTNTYSGTVSGYFRDDRFNAKDNVVDRVLPYSNQQFSLTFGGPIVEDKVHFFAHYEGEREPLTIAFNSPYPFFNSVDLSATRRRNMGGIRIDSQLSPSTRLMGRASGWVGKEPPRGSTANHPSAFFTQDAVSGQVLVSLTQTTGRSVNELKASLAIYHIDWANIVPGAPQILLRGYQIGGTAIYNPLREYQNTYSLRNDFSLLRGSHELKVGGEMLVPSNFLYWAQARYGRLDATGGPVPSNIEELFPVWNDHTTWNLEALSPITRSYQRSFGTYNIHCDVPQVPNCYRTKPVVAGWIQDNWQATNSLSLNLGLRWDFALDGLANEVSLPPVRTPQPQDKMNFGPRVGFAYSLPSRKTVLRGGWGIYFAGVSDTFAHTTVVNIVATAPSVLSDGRPDFASNPFNGPAPTFEEVKQGRRDMLSIITAGNTPYSHQTSIGFQHQIGDTMALEVDYVYTGARNSEHFRNANMSFDPTTGVNFPFTDISKRPYPDWGVIPMRVMDAVNNYHGLQTGFTKRFSNRWQASATYTLSGEWDSTPLPINHFVGCVGPVNGLTMTCDTPFDVAKDLGGEYTHSGAGVRYGAGDQRHRGVFNGIWDVGSGFQLSGLYSYGSGLRYGTIYGADLRDEGGVFVTRRLRPDGTLVPRNDFVGDPVHRVDLRLQQRIPLGGGVSLDGIFEVFNLLNHANFGSYTTAEVSPAYGKPNTNLNAAFLPRVVQLGFRMAF